MKATQDHSSKAILATADIVPIETSAAKKKTTAARKLLSKVTQRAAFKILNVWQSLQNMSVEKQLVT